MGTITRSFANKVTADGVSSLDSTVITGATAETTIAGGDSILLFDDSASALRKMTRTNFVAGIGSVFGTQLLHVRDEKASSNNGGTLATGSFVTRALNTVMTNEITGASLSSNQIILPSGTYFITARVPAFRVERFKTKLRNITDSSDTLLGTSEHFLAAAEQTGDSKLCGRFTIAAQKTFEIQCRIETSNSSLDGGVETGTVTSLTEIYTDAQIWKVA